MRCGFFPTIGAHTLKPGETVGFHSAIDGLRHYQLMVSSPSRNSKLFSRVRKLIPNSDWSKFSITAAGTFSIESCPILISRRVTSAKRVAPWRCALFC